MVLNLMPECRKWHFWASRFQNFLGKNAPRFPLREGPYSPWSGAAANCNFNRVCCLLQNLMKALTKNSGKMSLAIIMHSHFFLWKRRWKLMMFMKLIIWIFHASEHNHYYCKNCILNTVTIPASSLIIISTHNSSTNDCP